MAASVNRQNIILCGFMGCGKTTVGKILANLLNTRAIDVDKEIEKAAGMPIPEIFKEKGEDFFRDMEHLAIKRILEQSGFIMCTGGGALTYERNVTLLREKGVIVFLNPGFDICYSRIKHTDRPLVTSNTKESLSELYTMREALYRRACHIEVNAQGDELCWAKEIIAQIEAN